MQQNFGNRLEILKKGYLVYKKAHKVFVMLCAPVSIADVATVYHTLFPGKEGIQNRAAILGNIAYAAMEETPVMILLQSEKNTTRPNFIHFIDVNTVEDEVAIGTACSIKITTSDHVLFFSATTSTEYQGWINAFQEAYRQAHSRGDEMYRNEIENLNEGFDNNVPGENYNTNLRSFTQNLLPRNPTLNSNYGSSSSNNNHRMSTFSDISTSQENNNTNTRGSKSSRNSEPLFSRIFSSCKSPDPDMIRTRSVSSRPIDDVAEEDDYRLNRM